ncbi:MAG: pyroglutamyl-peptidase I family protein [Aliihoeflea sp.]|uniref:pyroglutamyl-peptidase I family protein n=1 Tax=Aliihoeflea sp. TaxID=2608088 RepID=UPI00403481F3
MTEQRRPRILLTGFSVFPGAPVNPTEALVGSLRETPPAIDADLKTAVLSVEYDTITPQLASICADFQPDIALHFGLARECTGFRFERVARNTNAKARPDNLGNLPAAAAICAGPETIASTLPLEEIEQRLAAAGLPVEWSDDAGGYLCNTVFTLSAAHACDGLKPTMTGFIHVPPLDIDVSATGATLSLADLRRGADIILSAAIDAWGGS